MRLKYLVPYLVTMFVGASVFCLNINDPSILGRLYASLGLYLIFQSSLLCILKHILDKTKGE